MSEKDTYSRAFTLTRREFMRLAVNGALGGILSACTIPSEQAPAPATVSQLAHETQSLSTEILPSEVLDLTGWKLTLPVGEADHPEEILQPELAGYSNEPWFLVTEDGNGTKGVLFRASVTGVTTSGSDYPRTELREMNADGTEKAEWSSSEGEHILWLDQAITAVPEGKSHIVAGQIHDEEDDVMAIRLEVSDEDSELFIDVDGDTVYVLDSQYALGTRFTVTFAVSGDQTAVYYNDSTDPVYVLSKSYSGAYFKAGAYPQSNCKKEDDLSCRNDNYGEVIIYGLDLNHQ